MPTPALLAADPDTTVADAATIVMSWLEGRPRWDGSPRQRWLDQIVDTLVELHQIEVSSPPGRIPRISRYAQSAYEPPRWSQRPQVWERAFEIFHGPIPESEDRFIHRDLHPGNLLWRRHELTGVVDWQAACVGPSSADPGHCRLNMFYDDPALADQLRITWEQRSGQRYHPWADVNAIVGVLDHIRTPKNPSRARVAIEHALANAVTDLSDRASASRRRGRCGSSGHSLLRRDCNHRICVLALVITGSTRRLGAFRSR